MVRRTTIGALAALALACGSSNHGSGTSGGSNVSVPSGAYAGTYTNGAGLSVAGTCSVAGFPDVHGALLLVGLSSSGADLCQAVTQGREPANATTLTLTVAKLNATGQAQAITPGTYTVFDVSGGSVPTPDLSGNVSLATATASKSGTSAGAGQGCTQLSSEDAASGSVTITSVTATSAAGSVSVTLKNGAGTLSGSFSVPLCTGGFTLGGSCESIGGVPTPTSCQ